MVALNVQRSFRLECKETKFRGDSTHTFFYQRVTKTVTDQSDTKGQAEEHRWVLASILILTHFRSTESKKNHLMISNLIFNEIKTFTVFQRRHEG